MLLLRNKVILYLLLYIQKYCTIATKGSQFALMFSHLSALALKIGTNKSYLFYFQMPFKDRAEVRHYLRNYLQI